MPNPYAPDGSNFWFPGAFVSDTFMRRWRSGKYVGNQKPWAKVRVRRGFFHRTTHTTWPGDLAPLTVRGRKVNGFGHVVGRSPHDLFYPQWTPIGDWMDLPGVAHIDLDQQINYAGTGGNGIAVATLAADNAAWVETAGALGPFHMLQRGWLWPWRGWVPNRRPGGNPQDQDAWYGKLPNAQIEISQGYGEDTAVKTFTGLIDTAGPGGIRPDRISIVARDFGSVMVDVNPFAWNRDPWITDPMYFVPPNYARAVEAAADKGHHSWVTVEDASSIVRCVLRWCGFQEYIVEESGVGLKTAYLVDRSRKWMDIINDVAAQLGYVFFIAEPTPDDLSIGVPVFRRQSTLVHPHPKPIMLDKKLITDVQPTHDNANDRFIIRVRGALAKRSDGGRPIIGGDMTIDGQIRYSYTYWPPWMGSMSGVIKQLTYYNIGERGVLGFTSTEECRVAAVLIAVQIALARDQAVVQCPGNPIFGLDSFAFVKDEKASGIASRLYVTGRKSTFTTGGDGTSQSAPSNTGGGSDQMFWSTELTGSLIDNPEFEQIYDDYRTALAGNNIPLRLGTGQWC